MFIARPLPWRASPGSPAPRRRRCPARAGAGVGASVDGCGTGRAHDLHGHALLQRIHALEHDAFARREPFGDGDALALRHAERDLADRRLAVGLDDVDEGPERRALDRGRRHDGRGTQRRQLQVDVDELVREQLVVGVLEDRPEADRAGRRVDLVVHRAQRARRQQGRLGAVPGLDGRRVVAAHRVEHRGQVGLGHGEQHRDRLHLRDDDDAVDVAAAYEVADVHLAQPEPAGNGRDDLRERQLQLRVVHLGVVGLDCALDLLDQRLLGRELLPGNELALEQRLEVLQVGARVVQPGLVLRLLPLGLRQRDLVGTRVDLGQDLARPLRAGLR